VEQGALLVTDGAVDFGTGVAGEEVSRTVRITNVGAAALDVELAVTGAGYSLDLTEALSLAPFGVAERVITLRRGAVSSQGMLTVGSSDPAGPSSVRLTEKRDGDDAGTGGGTDGGATADGETQSPGDGGTSGGADGGMDILLPAGCSCSGGTSSIAPFGLALLLGALGRRRAR